MRKQYILVDTSTSSFHTIHTALVYAKAAELSGLADIKLVFTPMLFAEKEHTNNALKRHTRTLPPEKTEKTRYSSSHDTDGMSLYDLIDAYSDYVEVPPASKIETKVVKALAAKLERLDNTNIKRLRASLGTDESKEELLNKDTLMQRLEDPRFFAKAYDICSRNRNFRDRMDNKGLRYDLADKSMSEWYRGLDNIKKDSDVMLLSRDGKLINYMKAIHDQHHSPAPDKQEHLERFDHFTMTGFAQHVLSDVNEMRQEANKTEGNSELNALLDKCKNLSEWTLAHKKGGGSLRNEHIFSSRSR